MSAIVLPEKLSELALLGLACLAQVEAKPETYQVTMAHWHEPIRPYPGERRCRVCFGGAVMAVHFSLSPFEWSSPGYFQAPTRGRLLALDALRCGSLGHAALLAHLDGAVQMQTRRVEAAMPDYDSNPGAWREAMRGQALRLQEAGL